MRLLVLDRYIVRELAAPLGFGCVLLTFFLVIDRIYSLTDLVITKGVPFYLVVQLLAFMLPSFLAITLPMAFLSAVLLAGGRLASDLEIVAFRAAGVSAVRLYRPVLLASLVIMAATAWFTLVLNPLANREFQRQLFRILQAKAASGLQERIFLGTFGDVTIYVEDVSVSQVALRGLLVSDERDPKLSRIITAREGRPNFQLVFYVLTKKGEYAGVAMWGREDKEPQRFAVCTEKGPELLACEPLFEGEPAA